MPDPVVTVNNTAGAAVSSFDTTHAHPSGSNRVFAFVGVRNGSSGYPSVTATYGGVAMTSLGSVATTVSQGTAVHVLEIRFPPTGSATGAVSFSISSRATVFWVSAEVNGDARAIDSIFENDQTGHTTQSVTPTSASGELVFSSTHWSASAAAVSSYTGTNSDDQGVGGQNSRGAFSWIESTGATQTKTINWSNNANRHSMLGFSVARGPEAAGPTITSIPALTRGAQATITGTGFGT